MLDLITGVGMLAAVLVVFTLFSMKAPGGGKAMSGMADAAVATFLTEAILVYVLGDQGLLGIKFFGDVGAACGSCSGIAAAALVCLQLGVTPVYALVAGVACYGMGILPGFIAGYIMALIIPKAEKILPAGVDCVVIALVTAPLAFGISHFVDPGVTKILAIVGGAIDAATNFSPIVMGILLGGIMKVICTAPLSSMALTAMLMLTGLPMGIASIACVAGGVANGVTFKRLGYGNTGNVAAVIIEPLTQARIVTTNPLQIYSGSFVGGAFGGVIAAILGIVSNAPGTASPVPGLLVPLGFNPPAKVLLAAALAVCGGLIGGFITSTFWKKTGKIGVTKFDD